MLQTLTKPGFHLWICCAFVLLCESAQAVEGTGTKSSDQSSWGVISFRAEDAQFAGDGSTSGEQVVSLAKQSDMVSWNYKPARWGMYDVEVSYSAEGKGGVIQVEVSGKQFSANYSATAKAASFTNLVVGRLYMEKAEPFTLQVKRIDLGTDSNNVLNLRRVTLSPAPEGKPVVQHGNEPVTLHASNAITHSVTMRYEPKEKKNCLGYWVNPQDWAEWKFTVTQTGTYDVELWQGCGKGQGGSDVDVVVDGERFSFVVEETGHFQNFVPRQIGRGKFSHVGIHSIEVLPRNKHADAIMDIRQILLKPVKEP